jgi:hypothetical protein
MISFRKWVGENIPIDFKGRSKDFSRRWVGKLTLERIGEKI